MNKENQRLHQFSKLCVPMISWGSCGGGGGNFKKINSSLWLMAENPLTVAKEIRKLMSSETLRCVYQKQNKLSLCAWLRWDSEYNKDHTNFLSKSSKRMEAHSRNASAGTEHVSAYPSWQCVPIQIRTFLCFPGMPSYSGKCNLWKL